MIQIRELVDLTPFATMHVPAVARYFVQVESTEELKEALEFAKAKHLPFKVLGEGSNMLFAHNFDGLIIQIRLSGMQVLAETDKEVLLKVAAGENWHNLVHHCVKQDWGGIENLALIPGTVGAAPVQNIGAYGVELKDVFIELEALQVETGEVITFDKKACRFGYRESIFKQELKDKAIILSITLRLEKHRPPTISYHALKEHLKRSGISNPSIQQVAEAVITIRRSKLPDPNEIGNNGSFFKNPVIPVCKYEELKQQYPNMPGYPVTEQQVKIPAAWLIEQAGWKGKRKGDAGVYPKQALILVNYGKATGGEILELAREIMEDVHQKFGVHLQPEVNILF